MIDRSKKLPGTVLYQPHGAQSCPRMDIGAVFADRHTVGKASRKLNLAANRTSTLCSVGARLVGGAERSRQQPDCAGDLLHGDGHMILLHGFNQEDAKDAEAGHRLALKRKREVT